MTIDFARVRKALVAGAGALSASLATGAADGSLSRTDWVIAAVAAASVGWATWRVPNRPVALTPPADDHGVEDHPAGGLSA